MTHRHIEVLLIGGQLYRHSVVATGSIAAEQIAGIVGSLQMAGLHVISHDGS